MTSLAVLLMTSLTLMAESAPVPSHQAVLASDLENGLQIIGLLGVPLGQLVSIRARIVPSDSKEAEQYVEVLDVSDKRLSEPLKLTFSVREWGNLSGNVLPLYKVMSLRVYETGGMVGVPQNAMKETAYVGSVGWGFRTSVVILYEEP
jgi:hypothetical protein